MKHLPPGTRVRLTRDMTDDDTSCGEYPKGCLGALIDEDGDMLFHPDGFHEGWGFYLAPEDYQKI